MRQLRFFRAGYCTSLAIGLVLCFPYLEISYQRYLGRFGARVARPELPPLAVLGTFGPRLVPWHGWIGYLLVVSLLVAAFAERHARPALILALTLFLLYGGIMLSRDWHYATYGAPSRVFDLPIPLLLLLLLEPGSWREYARVPRANYVLRAIELSIALVYFGSGVAKLRAGWAGDGGLTFRSYLLLCYHDNGSALAFRVAQSLRACGILAAMALAFELSAPFLVLFRLTRKGFFVTALGFHLFAEVVMRVWFFLPLFGPAFLIFLPVDVALDSWRRNCASRLDILRKRLFLR